MKLLRDSSHRRVAFGEDAGSFRFGNESVNLGTDFIIYRSYVITLLRFYVGELQDCFCMTAPPFPMFIDIVTICGGSWNSEI